MEIGKEKGIQVKVLDVTADIEPKMNTMLRIGARGASEIDGLDVMIVGVEPTDRYVYIYYTIVGVAVG